MHRQPRSTRRSGEVLLDEVRVPRDRILASVTDRHVVTVAVILAGAEIAVQPAGPREGGRARPYPRPVRPADRSVPGIKHKLADLACAVEQMTALAWDAASRSTPASRPRRDCADSVGALALDGGVGRQGPHSGARGDRLHLGARRPRLPPARHDPAQLLGGSVGRRAGWRSRRSPARGGPWASSSHPRRQRRASASCTGRAVAAAPLEEHRRLMANPACSSRTGLSPTAAAPGRSNSS